MTISRHLVAALAETIVSILVSIAATAVVDFINAPPHHQT